MNLAVANMRCRVYLPRLTAVLLIASTVLVMPPKAAHGAAVCPGTGPVAYLAEGSTRHGFDEWIALVNPALTATAQACLTYLTADGPVAGGDIAIPPQTRRSIHVNSAVTASSVSAQVETVSGEVVAERSMTNSRSGVKGAHAGKQVPAARSRWLMAEGSTRDGSETWILVANPSGEIAEVTTTFLTEIGRVPGPSFSLAPQTRRSIRAGAYVTSYNVATEVESGGGGVVAERATYLAHSGLVGATASPGVADPAENWLFAEGATAGGFETWILVANPSETDTANVTIDHLTPAGAQDGAEFALAPQSRTSIRVGEYVQAIEAATRVSSDMPIVAERAMYANHPVLGRGSATSEGSAGPAAHWVFAEGATRGGYESWILLSNPDASETANVGVTYLTGDGPIAGPTVAVGPGQRRSVRVDDAVYSYDVGVDAAVLTGPEVVAERSVYTPSGPAHDLTSGPGIAADPPESPPADPVVIAAGDIACDPTSPNYNGGAGTGPYCRQMATSNLALSESASAVLVLGDAQYETGDYNAFLAAYEPSWGRLKAITHPVPGNHEYYYGSAPGYYSYFGSSAASSTEGWYSFDLGTWHIVALNSNCAYIGGCDAGSPQESWLRADLAAHPNACTAAFWHHPRFSSGWHGQDFATDPLWRALYDAGADVILNGHDHHYERFAPQTPDSVSDSVTGITEFIVGTGGKDLRDRVYFPAYSEAFDASTQGVLKMTLRPDAYDWEFLPIPGGSFTDVGSAACS